MRKLLSFIILSTVTAFAANAQIQKGNVMIGGNLTNINLGLDAPHIFSVDITPKVAWFIDDNIALGGDVNFGLKTAKNSNTVTSYGVSALGRYYAGKGTEVIKHGRFFAEATAGIGGTNVSNGGVNTNGLKLSVGPGFAYFVTPNIGLETLFKYDGLVGFGSATTQNNLNLSFGLQIYLPGKSTAKKIKSDIK